MQIHGLDRHIEEYAYRNMHAPYTYMLMYSKVGKKVVNTCTHIDRPAVKTSFNRSLLDDCWSIEVVD